MEVEEDEEELDEEAEISYLPLEGEKCS